MGQKMCGNTAKARCCTNFRSSKGSTVERLLAMTLALSLAHAPSVPQGVGSDKLIKIVHVVMYLVCLVVLLSKLPHCHDRSPDHLSIVRAPYGNAGGG
jgi:hypothetical protein